MFRSHAPRPDTHPLMSQRTQGSLLISRLCHLTAEKASLPLHVHFSVIIKAENLFLHLLAISLNLFLSLGEQFQVYQNRQQKWYQNSCTSCHWRHRVSTLPTTAGPPWQPRATCQCIHSVLEGV